MSICDRCIYIYIYNVISISYFIYKMSPNNINSSYILIYYIYVHMNIYIVYINQAGQLINAIRKKLNVRGLSVPDLFAAPTVASMAKKIATLAHSIPPSLPPCLLDDAGVATSAEATIVSASGVMMVAAESLPASHRATASASGATLIGGGAVGSSGTSKAYQDLPNTTTPEHSKYGGFFSTPSLFTSSTSFSCLFIQLLPIAIFHPIRRMSTWFFVAQPWVILMQLGISRLKV